MWNSQMVAALRAGAIDVALALCPEIDGELAYESVRTERLVAFVGRDHALAGEAEISVRALADDAMLMFPRELGTRLYDALTALCRGSGFEPRLSAQSFHTVWGLGALPAASVGIAPAFVAGDTPSGVAAIRLSDPAAQLDTMLVWRRDDQAPAAAAFRATAHDAFDSA
jgi:LysR substrate binding domain